MFLVFMQNSIESTMLKVTMHQFKRSSESVSMRASMTGAHLNSLVTQQQHVSSALYSSFDSLVIKGMEEVE